MKQPELGRITTPRRRSLPSVVGMRCASSSARMLREHDERAKLIAEKTLDLLGEVRREVEVPTADAQRMDLWFQRLRQLAVVPGYLVLLDVLFVSDCIIEAFSQTLGLEEFWESHRKQYGWRRHLQEQIRPDPISGKAALLRPPFLWLLSSGRPESLFEEYRIAQRRDFPSGVYEFEGGWRIGLIVINELPPGKETLLLRLMGSAAVRRDALAELRGLPDSDPDAIKLRQIVAALRHTMRHATNISAEDREEFMTTTWADFERYEQELLSKGQKEGRKQGLCEAVQDLCEAFHIELTDSRRVALMQMEIPALDALRTHLKLYRSWPSAEG